VHEGPGIVHEKNTQQTPTSSLESLVGSLSPAVRTAFLGRREPPRGFRLGGRGVALLSPPLFCACRDCFPSREPQSFDLRCTCGLGTTLIPRYAQSRPLWSRSSVSVTPTFTGPRQHRNLSHVPGLPSLGHPLGYLPKTLRLLQSIPAPVVVLSFLVYPFVEYESLLPPFNAGARIPGTRSGCL